MEAPKWLHDLGLRFKPDFIFDVWGTPFRYGRVLDTGVEKRLAEQGITSDYGTWTDMDIVKVRAKTLDLARQKLLQNTQFLMKAWGVDISKGLGDSMVEKHRQRVTSPYPRQ